MHVILDIDGTIASAEHRLSHLNAPGGPNWEKFLSPELVVKDTPIPAAQRVVQKMQDLRYNIIFLTGRNEELRDVTSRWLLEHYNVTTDDTTLLMRPVSNMLKASEYKGQQMQLLLSECKARGETSFIFIDDDPYTFPVYGAEGVVLKAPDCWVHMFPDNKAEETEVAWRP